MIRHRLIFIFLIFFLTFSFSGCSFMQTLGQVTESEFSQLFLGITDIAIKDKARSFGYDMAIEKDPELQKYMEYADILKATNNPALLLDTFKLTILEKFEDDPLKSKRAEDLIDLIYNMQTVSKIMDEVQEEELINTRLRIAASGFLEGVEIANEKTE